MLQLSSDLPDHDHDVSDLVVGVGVSMRLDDVAKRESAADHRAQLTPSMSDLRNSRSLGTGFAAPVMNTARPGVCSQRPRSSAAAIAGMPSGKPIRRYRPHGASARTLRGNPAFPSTSQITS